MDKERKKEYAEILLNAYNNDVLRIIWSTSGFSIAVNPKKKEFIPEIKEDDFVEYAFSIIKLVAALAEDRGVDDEEENDIETARIIFEKEDNIKEHLYIKRTSKLDCYKLLEYEIISHRDEENPVNVSATSAILRMVIEKDEDEIRYAFEISRRDLEEIIDKLIELKEKISIIWRENRYDRTFTGKI